MKKLTRGFTLIELMVVMAVIAILATIILFGISQAQKAARDTQRQQIMNGIRTSLERYYGDNQSYPSTSFNAMMGTLTTGSYITAPIDPGCGTGKVTWSAGSGNWVPCGATGPVSYSYGSSGTAYTLTLYKEGGGTNLFLSPQ